jgi:signal peptidase II
MIAMMIALASVLVADRISKALVVARMPEGTSSPALLGIRFTHVMNRRLPWKSRAAMRFMALLLSCLVVAALFTVGNLESLSIDVAVGALTGGAVGNLLDGLNRQGVVDFIDLRVWPIFNIADAAIVAGAAWILWDLARLALANTAIG